MDVTDINYAIEYLKEYHPHIPITEDYIRLVRHEARFQLFLRAKKEKGQRKNSTHYEPPFKLHEVKLRKPTIEIRPYRAEDDIDVIEGRVPF